MIDGHLSRLLRAGVVLSVLQLIAITWNVAMAAPASPVPFKVLQPDGSEVTLHVRGDEHFNWTEDRDGYTVVKNQGWYEYAERGASGQLNPTGKIVGRDNPRALGLSKRVLPSRAVQAQSAKRVNGVSTSSGVSAAPQGVAPTGQIKNLVVMVRFSNHTGRSLPSVADMDVLFNSVGGDATLAPTGSVRDVYYENSYGQMTLVSDINPGIGDWITVSNTESYYANGNSGDSTLWQALREALDILDDQINFDDYDADNDGRIDSIAFIHSGYAAEWGGTDAFGTSSANRIWSHRWAIQPQWNSNDGVSVFDYHISPGVWGTSGSDIGRIGVIAHETGHFFGLPDLYDTDSGAGDGIGSWGLMANSWGFDFSQLCPPHFSPWSKTDLGWYTPTVISDPGQYTLREAANNPDAYRIDTGFPSGEYLLIENRQNAGFDCSIPQGGIAIWHIDDTTGLNTQGYPGQGGWPGNGNHYRVALLQADGDFDMEQGNNRGDSTDMHHAGGVDAIGPGPGNHPNTDTYQNGTINQTGIIISDISSSGPSMTFCLNGCSGLNAPSNLSASAPFSNQINLTWADNSDGETGFTVQRSANGSTWANLATTGAGSQSYSDTGLSPASTWYYRVRAFDASTQSGWSNTSNATTPQVAPTAPTGLQANEVSASQINLSWVDTSGNEDSYRVQRSLTGSGGWSTVANLGANSTSYSDTGLDASTEYFYRVASVNTAGASYTTGDVSATTETPPPFVDYVAQGQSNSEGSVSGSYTNTHTDNGSVQTITEQISGGNVRKARSSLSHRWTFTNVQPGNSISLTANAWSSGSSDSDNFTFQVSNDGSSYSNAFTVSSTSSGNVQTAVLSSGLSGTVYVRVVDTDNSRGGNTADSVSVDQLVIRVDNQPVTPPAAPSSLSATAAAYNQVNLSWTDNSLDETGFTIQRSTGGGSFSTLTTVPADSTSYEDASVSGSTTYIYRVWAVKGAESSGFTDSNSVDTPIEPVGSDISMSATGYKEKGQQKADVNWAGATSTDVDVIRDGSIVATTANDGYYKDNINRKGGGSYTYVVCEAGTSNCSDPDTVVF